MWAKPNKAETARMAKNALYSTEKTPLAEKIVTGHFFLGSCDWYVTEFDGEDLFFGYANLGDPQNAEWGYFSLSELKSVKAQGVFEVDFDKHWNVRPVSEVKEINL